MATAQALIIQKEGSVVNGASVPQAWPQVTPNGIAGQNLDLLQIISSVGGKVLVNVDYLGTVHFPAVNPTTQGTFGQTRIGQFVTRQPATASLAQIFADAFTNPSLLDIIQVIDPAGEAVHYNLTYQGVAVGS